MFGIDASSVQEKAKRLLADWSGRSDTLHKKKSKAISTLLTQPRIADKLRLDHWKWLILSKKIEHLQQAGSATEVDQILAEAKRDGKMIRIPHRSRFWLHEEECLVWSDLSLEGPPSESGYKRYMMVFQLVCQEHGLDATGVF